MPNTVENYTFDTKNKTLTLNDYEELDPRGLSPIKNITRNRILRYAGTPVVIDGNTIKLDPSKVWPNDTDNDEIRVRYTPPATDEVGVDDIDGATTVGKGLLTASSAAKARSTIGAKADDWEPSWGEVKDKPSTFTPKAHTHEIAEVVGLQAALDAKGTSSIKIGTGANDAKAGNWTPSWSEVSGKPSEFAPAAHTHEIADVVGLQGALDAKGTSNLKVGTGANDAKAGNWTPPNATTSTAGLVKQAAAVPDSVAEDVEGVASDLNTLMSSLRGSGVLAE